jgi:hypothetical protein
MCGKTKIYIVHSFQVVLQKCPVVPLHTKRQCKDATCVPDLYTLIKSFKQEQDLRFQASHVLIILISYQFLCHKSVSRGNYRNNGLQ